MPSTSPEPAFDIFAFLIASLGGLLGRIVAMTEERRNPLSWAILWEIPAAVASGFVGFAIGAHFGWSSWPLLGCAIVAGLLGPKGVMFFFYQRTLRRTRAAARAAAVSDNC